MADTRKTPIFDYDTGEFALGVGGTIKTAVGADAVLHIAQKALNTQLGKHSVYGNFEDFTKNHIYGSRVHDVAVRKDLPEAVRVSEIERETEEALKYDPRIKQVVSVGVYTDRDENGDMCYFTDVVITTYHNKQIEVKGVKIYG